MMALRQPRATAADLSAALAHRVDDIVPRLFPAARRNGAYWHIGDIDGHRGDSLYIHRSGPRAGMWQDAATGAFGDILDLAAAAMCIDLAGAMEWARGYLGISDTVPWEPPPPPPKQDDQAEAGRREALSIWAASHPAAGTLAETYFRHRAINLPVPSTVRFHPSLVYPGSGIELPALVAAVSGEDRRVSAVHRIYLRLDGKGKAGVRAPKMSRGPMGSGAVRLAPASEVLGLAEGVETAMSAMELHGVPCWAALGTRYEAVTIPESVRQLIVFADNGEAGQRAADRAVTAHQRAGRSVEVVSPQFDLKDWNDVARALVKGGADE